MDDIKANMDNIKRCSEISLNGYLENLIYYSGFLKSQENQIQNEKLKLYYDRIDYRYYDGDYYPILFKKISIDVPQYPYNSVGNKFYYYMPILDNYPKQLREIIELSVNEF
ncbi:MAG: hypothetical protein PHT94_01100, partial [Candidatus Nanoarchaeia archaeon]|nr:hypothetical protein [Candidatus Nanoarchaeia archaeon]